jgi:hypothetical protein
LECRTSIIREWTSLKIKNLDLTQCQKCTICGYVMLKFYDGTLISVAEPEPLHFGGAKAGAAMRSGSGGSRSYSDAKYIEILKKCNKLY